MKHILLAADPENPSITSMQFGCYLAQLTQSRLTVIFLEKHFANKVPALKTVYGLPYVETIIASDLPGFSEHQEMRAVYTATFKKICEDRGVRCNIHQDLDSPLEGLIAETRFADLLVVNRDICLGKASSTWTL